MLLPSIKVHRKYQVPSDPKKRNKGYKSQILQRKQFESAKKDSDELIKLRYLELKTKEFVESIFNRVNNIELILNDHQDYIPDEPTIMDNYNMEFSNKQTFTRLANSLRLNTLPALESSDRESLINNMNELKNKLKEMDTIHNRNNEIMEGLTNMMHQMNEHLQKQTKADRGTQVSIKIKPAQTETKFVIDKQERQYEC